MKKVILASITIALTLFSAFSEAGRIRLYNASAFQVDLRCYAKSDTARWFPQDETTVSSKHNDYCKCSNTNYCSVLVGNGWSDHSWASGVLQTTSVTYANGNGKAYIYTCSTGNHIEDCSQGQSSLHQVGHDPDYGFCPALINHGLITSISKDNDYAGCANWNGKIDKRVDLPDNS